MRLASLLIFVIGAISSSAQNALPNLRPPYAPAPADPYFREQWHLENRDTDGSRIGPDLNVRGAWQQTKGEGVIVAIAENGVEVTHPDLAVNAVPELHYDFEIGVTNGNYRSTTDVMGTAAAGLVAAALNGRGVAGVAPGAKFASWLIFPTNSLPGRSVILPEKMAAAFTAQTNIVAIQLHNWYNSLSGDNVFPQTQIESDAISNAVTSGRSGKGVVFVRPAGDQNFTSDLGWLGRNANNDAFASDPRVIAVAAARDDGRVASYSARGACILVAAPSGDFDQGFANIMSTDLTGTLGSNFATFPSDPDRSDYGWGAFGYSGTISAAPMVAGICALILSANPNLTYRDVQQVLIHSSRHFDKADPHLHRNGAGYWVSDRLGYGIPDAAEAVRVAKAWHNRPPMVRRTIASDVTTPVPIPDASLSVIARADAPNSPLNLSFVAFPSLGAQPDDPTPDLPLVDVGQATTPITQDLHGKAALIQRGGPTPNNTFVYKLMNAASAGAEFAVVYNSIDDSLLQMAFTDFIPIPSVFIGMTGGLTLKSNIVAQPTMRVQLRGSPAIARFDVTEQLLCEHVGVRIRTTHPARQDLRITLVSPMGTRSILQTFNLDLSAGPVDWTYYSTQHFYELSSGLWTLEITDEVASNTGNLVGADLIIEGTPIQDSDDDGLDDAWEMANFGSLDFGPLDDPDNDGSWNAREQALGTNPMLNETPFVISAMDLQTNAVRFAFPSVEGTNYTIRSSIDLNAGLGDVGAVQGDFGETEIISDKNDPRRFFQVREP